MRQVVAIAAVTAVSLFGMLGSAQAGNNQIHTSFGLPAALAISVQTSSCTASPGPQIALQGQMTLTGLNVDAMFRNTGPQVQQQPIVVEQPVVAADLQVTPPAQSLVGGLSADPFLWIQIVDAKGRPLTSELFLGQCSQGTFTANPNLAIPVEADAVVAASGCTSAAGPTITLDGAAELSALTANLIFRSANPATTPSGKIDQVTTQAVIFPAGQRYQIPTQPITANSQPNPLVSVQFSLEGGAQASTEQHLGRCSSFSAL